MIVQDDYLDRDVFESALRAIEDQSFRWEKGQVLSDTAAAHLDPSENVQFVHGFFMSKPGVFYRSDDYPIIQPIVRKLQPLEVLKVKLNMTTRKNRHIEYGLHVDTRRRGATTAIFYLNTNDGYTLFGDGTSVMSVANRMVLFDATTRHTGASCTDAERRLVLNINVVMPKSARPAITSA